MQQNLSFQSPRKFVPKMALETTASLRRHAKSSKKSSEKSLSEIMWEAAFPIAKQALQTNYIQGIKYGDLDPNDYGNYTVQDAIYCYQSTEQYKRLVHTTTDAQIKTFAQKQVKNYEEYTKVLFDKWSIADPPNCINLSPNLKKYIDYKSEVLRNENSLYFILANIPCLRLWSWLANELKDRIEVSANLYSFWIRDNLDPSYSNILEDFVNSKADELDSGKAISVYKQCMQGEFDFFALAGKVRNYLQEGNFLLPQDRLFSQNQKYYLIYQTDGNLVVYDSTDKVQWASDKFGTPWRTYMQDDGNFVVYTDYSKPIWSSGVYGSQYKGSKLFVQDNGDLTIYHQDKKIWSNNN